MRFANIQNQSLFIWLSQSSSVALTNLVLCETVFFSCVQWTFSISLIILLILFYSIRIMFQIVWKNKFAFQNYFTIMRIEYIQYRLYFNFNCHQITRNFLHSKFDTQKKNLFMILQSIENNFAMIATDRVSNSAFDVWIFNWILRYISHKWQLFYAIFSVW